MRKTISFLLMFFVLFLFACNNKEKQAKLNKIDSLWALLDSASVKLKLINKDTVQKKFDLYQKTNEKVAEHYQEYRNEENWIYVCAYQEVRKPFKMMLRGYENYKAQIDSSFKQLRNLKHDVKKNLLTDEEFKRYFEMEAKSVNAITYKINKNIDDVLQQYKNFDTVHPYMLKLLELYKKDNKTQKKE